MKYQYQFIRKSIQYIPVLFVFISFLARAQVYPVSVTTQMIPPYSLSLSEYNTAMSDKLIVNLLLTDINEGSRQVRLKLLVENNAGLQIQNNDFVVGATPIFLEGGVPLRLTNADLQTHFSMYNLRGIAPHLYSQPLPDGLYRFCFEVYDAFSGQKISRKNCATVYLVLNDPPFLNLPNRGEMIAEREPQNIIFQWTPRHLNATNVQYEFTLVELWDTQINPQAAFLSGRPLYQTTTYATTLLYGPSETSLLPDKTYGWRVRAIVSDGISETSVFKNGGYSEIYHFTYTAKCEAPQYALAESKSTTTQEILWQGTDPIKYRVQYRKKDAPNAVWFEVNAYNPQASIYNLEAGTTYQFRVGGQCIENGGYTYTQILEFTTALSNSETATYKCGITPEIVITNQKPLEILVVNETFTAGDFPVTVKEITSGNTKSPAIGETAKSGEGYFSGWGFIVVPYLQDTRIKVSFRNIRINSDYQLIEGVVETDYDSSWSGIDDISDELEIIKGAIDILIKNIKDKIDVTTQTTIFITETQKILDDPNNGISEEQKVIIQNLINDKEKIKKAVEQVKEDFKNGKNDEDIKDNLISNLSNTQASEEDIVYDDKEYMSKVFQKIRCAYVNSNRELDNNYFDKSNQEFTAFFQEYGKIKLILKAKESKLGKIKTTQKKVESGGGNKTDKHTLLTLDYGGVVITAKQYIDKETEEKLDKLQNYLFPSDISVIKEDYEKVLAQLLNKTEFTDTDIKELKRIANCGAQFFSTKNKYIIISKIANHSIALTEYYEDLILDLIDNHPKDIKPYSDELLGYFDKDPKLLRKLFNRTDNVDSSIFWKGNEDNFNRFLKIIFSLWKDSKYAQESNYTYVDDIIEATNLSPKVISYDGKSFFPSISYDKTAFYDTHLTIQTKTIHGKFGSLKYSYFQPVLLLFDNGTTSRVTKTEVPAIYFAGTVEKDNLEKSLDQLGLILDIGLTFTGVTAFTKLKYLTKLHQLGRIVLGTVEITSSVADIIVRYSDLCEGNEEFCEAFQEYNTYLQLGLLGSGLVRTKFITSRKKAKDAYEKHRGSLAKKYGSEDSRIKELDRHFGGNTVSNAGDKITKRLDDLNLNHLTKKLDDLDEILRPQFYEDFADASNDVLKKLQDENLFDVWNNNVRSKDIELLRDFAKRGNVRVQYAKALSGFVEEETRLLKQFENIPNKLEKVAKGMFELRLKTTTRFKLEKTPVDLLEWIHKFNVKRYTPIGGNKWGHTWQSIIKYNKSKGLEGDNLYKKIIASSKTPLGDGDKLKLGDALKDAFKNDSQFDGLQKTLEKYRLWRY